LSSFRIPRQNPDVFLFSLLRVTCPAHAIILDSISQKILSQNIFTIIIVSNILLSHLNVRARHPVWHYVSDHCADKYSGAYEGGRSRRLYKNCIVRSFMTNSPRHTVFFIGQQPLVGQGILTIEASPSHSRHTTILLRMRDQPDAVTSFHTLLVELNRGLGRGEMDKACGLRKRDKKCVQGFGGET
jgi:hypothetical protein